MIISGVVRDEHSNPVPGASVYVVDAPAALPDIALLTDGDGRFALSAPVAGRYTIEANAGIGTPARGTVEVGDGAIEIELRFSGPPDG